MIKNFKTSHATIVAMLAIIFSSYYGINQSMEGKKSTCKKAMDALFKNYSEEEAKACLTEDYVQHNPNVPTGRDAIIGLILVFKEAKLGYKTHRMLQDGDLVLTHTTYHNAEIFYAKKVVAFDIWRIKDGKVAEHWDAITSLVTDTASGRNQTEGSTEVIDLDKTAENKTLVKIS